MRTHTLLLSLSALVALTLALAACDDGGGAPGMIDGPVNEDSADNAVSNRLCYQWRACDCDSAAGVSLNGCETGIGFAWQATIEEAKEMGLTYDGDCLTRRLNAMLERGCAGFEPTAGGCGETCQVYHGDKELGEPCEDMRNASDCQQGLICDFSEGCVEPPPCQNFGPRPAGEPCVDEDMRPIYACAEGLLCDATGTGLCTSLPGAGQACVQFQCADGHWCDQTQTDPTCAAIVAEGQPCTVPQSCASFSCTDGICGPLPNAGEPCVAACAGDLVCANDGTGAVCQTLPGEGETCLFSTQGQCQEGLVCAVQTQTCVTPPGRGDRCPDFVCADALQCLARSCEATPSAPGCDECEDGDITCLTYVCGDPPAAVCGDSGGLL